MKTNVKLAITAVLVVVSFVVLLAKMRNKLEATAQPRRQQPLLSGTEISKAFVINLPKRSDRWQQINQSFAPTGLKLHKWEAINGKDLSDEYVKAVTSTYCNYLCSNSMIGIWLSHYTLWKHIVDHNLTNVLILEDDATPVADFNEQFKQYWRNIPPDWDIIFLGCFSCDGKSKGKQDNINGNPHLFIPSYPAGMHGYMVSHRGAQKLINELKAVEYHIDLYLSSNVFNRPKKGINMYAFKPFLIYQNTESESDNQGHTHQLLTNLVRRFESPDTHLPLSTMMNSQMWNIRHLDIPLTATFEVICIVAIIINLIPFDKTRNAALLALVLYEFSELGLTKPNLTRTKTISFEISVILAITVLMSYIVRPLLWKLLSRFISSKV